VTFNDAVLGQTAGLDIAPVMSSSVDQTEDIDFVKFLSRYFAQYVCKTGNVSYLPSLR
jgi:hypothetical protein